MYISYLQRYKEGEYGEVWDELIALGKDVRKRKVIFDALDVARETMRRVKYNAETVVERLHSLGYEFEGIPYQAPLPEDTDNIEGYEENMALLPLSIRAFYEIVGQIDLCESFTTESRTKVSVEALVMDGDGGLSDALVVLPVHQAIAEYENWVEYIEAYGKADAGSLRIPIAPDAYHKADISGGDFYNLQLPNLGMDAMLMQGDEEEWHHTTFVNYLRICFKWGGFPGWEKFQKHPDFPTKEMAFLTKDLLPF